jgi:hypothetical protein
MITRTQPETRSSSLGRATAVLLVVQASVLMVRAATGYSDAVNASRFLNRGLPTPIFHPAPDRIATLVGTLLLAPIFLWTSWILWRHGSTLRGWEGAAPWVTLAVNIALVCFLCQRVVQAIGGGEGDPGRTLLLLLTGTTLACQVRLIVEDRTRS